MNGHTLRVDFDDGECVHIAPDRAIAAVASSEGWSTIWYFDGDSRVQHVHINAELVHVLDSLSLPFLGHDIEGRTCSHGRSIGTR